jgi:catechol 2,3-dioxygenase-like lactoylglutathione lyase family enzyme
MKPTCTHVALFCRDIEASVAFYARHVGLREVHRRVDDGTTVVWMGEERDHAAGAAPANDVPSFVIVLLGISPPGGEGSVAHLGYAVSSREEVTRAAERGHAAGLDVQGPVEAGPIVGYYCLLRDPDGNWVEFSHGQALGPIPH